MYRLAASALSLLVGSIMMAGCAVDSDVDADPEASEDSIVAKADEHWFYSGPLPALREAKVVTSLAGNTARVVGYLPDGVTALPAFPNVKLTPSANGRTRVDIVYPIATAAPPKTNSRPGTYSFYGAKPYRPDGIAYTVSQGNHFVPWGGFPFLGYNDGIAFHGPITAQAAPGAPDTQVWYLRRGDVSAGCNRMMGEHVTELAHVLGINMRKVWNANQMYSSPTSAKVEVIADYDMFEGKYIDVDYATDVGVTRPGKIHGDDKVVMFGSWVASEQPDGKDLPANMAWEGGVSGRPYVFKEHARNDMVCSYAKRDLEGLKVVQRSMGGELPRSLCAKKACIVEAIRANKAAEAKARCGL
ncbi:MAG: L,D-transpeptidase [Labilithrix sp.]|nr:L,D-transpeptidase [Labilithrix sp.]